MNDLSTLNLNIDPRGVAHLSLNRPEARNAMDPVLIQELGQTSEKLAQRDDVRLVVLSGEGEAFCAGGDLKWMRSNFEKNRQQRVEESASLAKMLSLLDGFPKLLIGRINGAAYGGGLGLISICDIAVAAASAQFCLTETTLGLTPANISPYVVTRIGAANARYCFLNARPLDASDAQRIGLVHRVVDDSALDDAIEQEIRYALRCAPGAVSATKELIQYVSTHDADTNRRYTADRLADAWESREGQHGVLCFFDKKKPDWRNTTTGDQERNG